MSPARPAKSTSLVILALALPLVAGAVVIGVLSAVNKESYLEARVKSQVVFFALVGDQRGGPTSTILRSLAVERVRVTGVALALSQPESKRWTPGNAAGASWFLLEAPKGQTVRLHDVIVPAGTRVTLSVRPEDWLLSFAPPAGENCTMEISLAEAGTGLVLNQMSADGQPVAQKKETIPAGHEPLFLQAPGRWSVAMAFPADRNEEVANVIEAFLRVKTLDFPSPNDAQRAPVDEARLKFPRGERATAELGGGFVRLAAVEGLELTATKVTRAGVTTDFAGKVSSVRMGATPAAPMELLPSWLEWLRQNQQVAMLVSALAWLSSSLFGAIAFAYRLRSTARQLRGQEEAS